MERADFDAVLSAFKAQALPEDGASSEVWDAFYAEQARIFASLGWDNDSFWAAYLGSDQWFIDSTNDWLRSPCTTERSVNAAQLERWSDLLGEMDDFLDARGARWIAYECDTCSHHTGGDRPIHLSIETYQFCPYDASRARDSWGTRAS